MRSSINKNIAKSKRYTAFTLAEVLITLGIIGIVAAMTIPSLVQRTNNKELVVAAKKTFSIFSELQNRMIADNINFSDIFVFGETNTQSINRLAKYMKIENIGDSNIWNGTIKYASALNDGYGNYTSSISASSYGTAAQLADGARIAVVNASKGDNCGSTTWGHYETDSNGNYVLDSNGNKKYILTGDVNFCAQVVIDTNGNKGPNQFGKDTFMLLFFPSSFSQHSYTSEYGNLKKIIVEGKM